MKQEPLIYTIAGKNVRAITVDGEKFVCLDDIQACLEESIQNLVEITRRYESRMAVLKNSLETLTESMAKEHPEVLEELERANDPKRWN